jgi:cob(I)alamin adenosyltransferase
MSIVTKTGDDATTALLYNRRIAKADPRVEAYGTVDELNAALGVARAAQAVAERQHQIRAIQQDLIGLMGELATHPDDADRYARDGYPRLTAASTAQLETLIRDLEAHQRESRGWAIPGATHPAAALDVARTICRRAERRVCALAEAGPLPNREILVYLNRLGDLLWLLARWAETPDRPSTP